MDITTLQSSLAVTRFNNVKWFDDLDSTNSYAIDAAGRGEPEGLVVIANEQSAGRGRMGRKWIAPPGSSLLCSVLLRPAVEVDQAYLYSVAASLAIAETCRTYSDQVSLKWPNDVLIEEKKVAGVLGETVSEGKRLDAVVVGFGVNVQWPKQLPEEIADRATSLDRYGDVNLETVAFDVLHALDAQIDSGLDQVAKQFSTECATIGKQVRIETPDGEYEGTATSTDETGALVVDLFSGETRSFSVGDVIHLR